MMARYAARRGLLGLFRRSHARITVVTGCQHHVHVRTAATFVGAPWREDLVLRLGRAYEEATPELRDRRPPEALCMAQDQEKA